MMNRIHIVGRRNHGKTTLIVELVTEFCRRCVPVGTIKHSRHIHELDKPGKDSYRHRTAGAQPAAIVTQDSIGVFMPRQGATEYERLEPLFIDCQVVIVEGDIEAPGMKIEVWREAMGSACLASEREDIVAVVSDDRPDISLPIWPRNDVASLADEVLSLLLKG